MDLRQWICINGMLFSGILENVQKRVFLQRDFYKHIKNIRVGLLTETKKKQFNGLRFFPIQLV